MNEERSFERFVADKVAGRDSGIPLPDDFYDDMHSFATTTRQRAQWLALIKEPPMRTNNHLAVGSPTVRVMAIMAATLLLTAALAAAGVAGARLLASDGTIVVARDGSGTFETISEAVAMAEDGDEILVKPGTYAESVTIAKDITITGDGAPHEIVVEIAEDGPTDVEILGYNPRHAFYLDGAATTVGNLTVVGPRSNVSAFVVHGGSPTIHDVVANLEPIGDRTASFILMEEAAGVIRDNSTDLFLWVDGGSTPEIAGNVSTHVIRTNGLGTDPWIHGNVAEGIWVHDESAPLVEDNDIGGSTSPDCAIEVAGDARPLVRGNRVSGNHVGICAYDGGSIAELTGNVVTGNVTGLRLASASDVLEQADNIICGNEWDLTFGGEVPSEGVACSDDLSE